MSAALETEDIDTTETAGIILVCVNITSGSFATETDVAVSTVEGTAEGINFIIIIMTAAVTSSYNLCVSTRGT